jgi:DNA mismatch repair protein MSH5
MSIDMNSMQALGIFALEDHPNRHSTDRKDGFSIFQLMNKTRSAVGKKLLRSWFIRPLQDLDTISARHNSIDLFVNSNYASVAVDAHKLLSKVCNLQVISVIQMIYYSPV